jgi:hypothetical protein
VTQCSAVDKMAAARCYKTDLRHSVEGENCVMRLLKATLELELTRYNIQRCQQTALVTRYNIQSCQQTALVTRYNIQSYQQTALVTGYNIQSCQQTALVTRYNIQSCQQTALVTRKGLETVAVQHRNRNCETGKIGSGYLYTDGLKSDLSYKNQ